MLRFGQIGTPSGNIPCQIRCQQGFEGQDLGLTPATPIDKDAFMQLTGGQALARQLVLEGITDLFGVPGVQLDWAVDGLREVSNRIRYVVTRHEQAAYYMADGYARTTGRVGTCMVVPGPGLLNAMSGLATAYSSNLRVLSIGCTT